MHLHNSPDKRSSNGIALVLAKENKKRASCLGDPSLQPDGCQRLLHFSQCLPKQKFPLERRRLSRFNKLVWKAAIV